MRSLGYCQRQGEVVYHFKRYSGESTKRMFAATKTNVADDAVEVEDDSMAPGSSKESDNKRDHKKETPAQNKLRVELAEINGELASYACIRETTGLSDEYKKRVEALN